MKRTRKTSFGGYKDVITRNGAALWRNGASGRRAIHHAVLKRLSLKAALRDTPALCKRRGLEQGAADQASCRCRLQGWRKSLRRRTIFRAVRPKTW